MLILDRRLAAASIALIFSVCLRAQPNVAGPPADPNAPAPTKLEAFMPNIGTVFTVSHEDLGAVAGVRVDVREMRESRGKAVRGLIVEIPSQNGTQKSFVDADELAGLLGGCDALLQLNSNPSQFKNYEARFATRGSLELIASTTVDEGVNFRVQVGRFESAIQSLTLSQMQQLRGIFATAAQKIASLPD